MVEHMHIAIAKLFTKYTTLVKPGKLHSYLPMYSKKKDDATPSFIYCIALDVSLILC